jgi:predicted patatin/cPLA2 family phospholipase
MKKVLVLSGGGCYGAYQMGIVSKLIEENKGSWDLITGVSAGSINASYLSSIEKDKEKDNLKDFETLWTNIKNKDVYKDEFFFNKLSYFDNTPLKNKLSEIFGSKKAIRPIIISSTSLKNGKAVHFYNEDIEKYGFTDLILSSTAIPILFPPHAFLDDIFCDGGLTSNILLFESINYCLKHFPDEDISIDIIVCGKEISSIDIDEKNITFKTYIERLISIIQNQVEYFQILDKIDTPRQIKIKLYEQLYETSYSLLDFDSCKELWNQGYNFTNVKITDIPNPV